MNELQTPPKTNGARTEPLNVQVYRIDGDLVELLFYPRQLDLRVGETLTLRERDTGRSVIAQVIAFRSASYPSLVQEQMLHLLGPEQLDAPLLDAIGYRLFAQSGDNGRSVELGNIKVAQAKIRKTVPGGQQPLGRHGMAGSLPEMPTFTAPTTSEVFANATRNLGHPLNLGRTLAGHRFQVEGQDLEKVNVITGVKGSGKSHLAKVILLQLIEQGAPCLVFDINREYIHLPKAEIDPRSGETIRRGIVHLEAGGNFRLGVRQFGLAPLMTLLQRYGLPEVSALYLENRLARLWEEAEAMEREGRKRSVHGPGPADPDGGGERIRRGLQRRRSSITPSAHAWMRSRTRISSPARLPRRLPWARLTARCAAAGHW